MYTHNTYIRVHVHPQTQINNTYAKKKKKKKLSKNNLQELGCSPFFLSFGSRSWKVGSDETESTNNNGVLSTTHQVIRFSSSRSNKTHTSRSSQNP